MPTYSLKDFSKRFDRFAKDELRRAVLNGLVLAAQRGQQLIISTIIPSRQPPPVDRGTYRGGWTAEPLPGVGAIISNDEGHAAIIEHGARPENVKPGSAMIAALSEWVVRKGLASDPADVKQTVWAIVASMKRRGIFNPPGSAGLGVLKELVERHLPGLVQEEVEREIERAARRSLG